MMYLRFVASLMFLFALPNTMHAQDCVFTGDLDACLAKMASIVRSGPVPKPIGSGSKTTGSELNIASAPIHPQVTPQDTAAFDIELSLLVWQHFQRRDYQEYSVLGCATYRDTAGNSKWALVTLTTARNGELWYSWQPRGKERFQVYDHSPSNMEIYAYLDSLPGGVSQMFVYDEDGKFRSTYTLIEGRVCVEKWEEVTGEKPTKFFPEIEKE